jgi:hypothetical protein
MSDLSAGRRSDGAAATTEILLLLFNSSKTSAKSRVKPQNHLNYSKQGE